MEENLNTSDRVLQKKAHYWANKELSVDLLFELLKIAYTMGERDTLRRKLEQLNRGN